MNVNYTYGGNIFCDIYMYQIITLYCTPKINTSYVNYISKKKKKKKKKQNPGKQTNKTTDLKHD